MSDDDPTIAQIKGLSPTMAQFAVAIINELRSFGIPAGIVDKGGRRSTATQKGLVEANLSRTFASAHLTGDAVDIDILGMSRDDLPLDYWVAFGYLVESYGLVWGGRWENPFDPAHVELPKNLRSSL